MITHKITISFLLKAILIKIYRIFRLGLHLRIKIFFNAIYIGIVGLINSFLY